MGFQVQGCPRLVRKLIKMNLVKIFKPALFMRKMKMKFMLASLKTLILKIF